MLRGFEQCVKSVVEYGKDKAVKGNFKVERDEDLAQLVWIYHYNNVVAVVNINLKKLAKNKVYWNYSKSTTRLCNDILNYFNDYTILESI